MRTFMSEPGTWLSQSKLLGARQCLPAADGCRPAVAGSALVCSVWKLRGVALPWPC